eukprot:2025710-Amphidinium_carterae.1
MRLGHMSQEETIALVAFGALQGDNICLTTHGSGLVEPEPEAGQVQFVHTPTPRTCSPWCIPDVLQRSRRRAASQSLPKGKARAARCAHLEEKRWHPHHLHTVCRAGACCSTVMLHLACSLWRGPSSSTDAQGSQAPSSAKARGTTTCSYVGCSKARAKEPAPSSADTPFSRKLYWKTIDIADDGGREAANGLPSMPRTPNCTTHNVWGVRSDQREGSAIDPGAE